jgi:hypothetical protein
VKNCIGLCGFDAVLYGSVGSLYMNLWFFLIFSAKLCDPLYVYYEFLGIFLQRDTFFMIVHEELNWLLLSTEKIMCKCKELYFEVDGSTITIIKNFLQVHCLTRNLEGSRNKNQNMCRDFFGKTVSPILMH